MVFARRQAFAALLLLGQIAVPTTFTVDPADWPARPRTGPRLVVTSFNINQFDPHVDGQWQGSRAASDGKVYFFASTHSGGKDGASFYQFDPATGRLTQKIANLSLALGETNAGWGAGQSVPQGKVHSDIVEHNGWLYAVSHLADETRRVDWQGSHVFAYNLGTGAIRDFGIPKVRYTGYSGISLDPARNVLFVFMEPAFAAEYDDLNDPGLGPRMYRYDVTGAAPQAPTDLGRINTGMRVGADASNFYQFTDKRGDTWFTVRNDPGSLYRIAAGTTGYTRYPNALPKATNPLTGAPTAQSSFWFWGQPLGDGNRFIFTQSQPSGGLWQFDASKVSGTNAAAAFTLLAHIGPTNLGMALDGTTLVFTRQVTEPGNRTPHTAAVQGDATHLMTLDLTSLMFSDHGLIVDTAGRRPWRIESMAAKAGRVFFSGDWYLLANGATPPSPSETGTYRYQPNHTFVPYTRGHFFAVAEIRIGASARYGLLAAARGTT